MLAGPGGVPGSPVTWGKGQQTVTQTQVAREAGIGLGPSVLTTGVAEHLLPQGQVGSQGGQAHSGQDQCCPGTCHRAAQQAGCSLQSSSEAEGSGVMRDVITPACGGGGCGCGMRCQGFEASLVQGEGLLLLHPLLSCSSISCSCRPAGGPAAHHRIAGTTGGRGTSRLQGGGCCGLGRGQGQHDSGKRVNQG